jgi:hypothetical protein
MLMSKPDVTGLWPLRFRDHFFDAQCINTLSSSVIYNDVQFGHDNRGAVFELVEARTSSPQALDWRDCWLGSTMVRTEDSNAFPGPVEIEWISLDGTMHDVSVDLSVIFPGQKILHRVELQDLQHALLENPSVQPVRPTILLEVNDSTVKVYMRALVALEREQYPGNPYSRFRNDRILAWEKTF